MKNCWKISLVLILFSLTQVKGQDPVFSQFYQAQSSINFYMNEDMFKMFFGSFTMNIIDPQILFNDGFYDLVDVRIPKAQY